MSLHDSTDVSERANRLAEQAMDLHLSFVGHGREGLEAADDVAAPGEAGLVVAEGDSWFDYPGSNVLEALEWHFHYDVWSVAKVMDTLEEERWQRDRDLFVAAAEKLGADVLVQSAGSDDARQIAQCENLLTRGVDVLVVVPHNGKAAAAVVEMAHRSGVKVIAYDRMINDANLDLYVSFDNERIGELQAQYLVEQVPRGNYVLIGGDPADFNSHLYRRGQMRILQPSIDRGDIAAMCRAGHTLKAALRMFGEPPAHEFAARLEQCEAVELNGAAELLAALCAALEPVERELAMSLSDEAD